MPLARIITHSLEHSADLAEQLRARGFEVEILSPGEISSRTADLEVKLEECTPEEALIRASVSQDSEDPHVFIALGAIAGVTPLVTIPLISERCQPGKPVVAPEPRLAEWGSTQLGEDLASSLSPAMQAAADEFTVHSGPVPLPQTTEEKICEEPGAAAMRETSVPHAVSSTAPSAPLAETEAQAGAPLSEGYVYEDAVLSPLASLRLRLSSLRWPSLKLHLPAPRLRLPSLRLRLPRVHVRIRRPLVPPLRFHLPALRFRLPDVHFRLPRIRVPHLSFRLPRLSLRLRRPAFRLPRLSIPATQSLFPLRHTLRVVRRPSSTLFWDTATAVALLAVVTLMAGQLLHRRVPLSDTLLQPAGIAEPLPFARHATRSVRPTGKSGPVQLSSTSEAQGSLSQPVDTAIPAAAIAAPQSATDSNSTALPSADKIVVKAAARRHVLRAKSDKVADDVVIHHLNKPTPPSAPKTQDGIKHYSDLD